MNKHILYISSFNDKTIQAFSDTLRLLGRKAQESIWGSPLKEGMYEGNILYLDSSFMGDLFMMAKSLKAPLIEYIFFDPETGRRIFLISELLGTEFDNGKAVFKMSDIFDDLLIKRCRALNDTEERTYSVIAEDPFFRIKPLSVRKTLVRSAVKAGCFSEIKAEGIDFDNLSDVYIADAFTKSQALSALSKALKISPSVIHIMSERADIYAPYSSTDSLIFKGDNKSLKEAFLSIYQELWDAGKLNSAKRIITSLPENGAEDFLSALEENLMKRQKRR